MRSLPAASGGLSTRRRVAGFALAAAGLPALTVGLVALRSQLSLESVLLLYTLAVVMVAVVGGAGPAVLAATVSFLLANRFLTPPYGEFRIADRFDVISLIVFVLVAVTVSITVDLAARSRVLAARNRLEAELLSRFAAAPVDDTSLTTVLEQVRETFGMTSVALLSRGRDADRTVGAVGPPLRGKPVISMDAGGGLRLVAEGPEIFAEDRRLLASLAAAAARSWEAQRLAGEAAQVRELAEIDRLRSALLAAVGHDLRTPLAGVKAAVSSLRQRDVEWTAEEREEFLAQIESSADRLDGLVANLLAMSRLQSGVLSVSWRAVALDEIVARALLDVHAGDVVVDVPDDLPLARTDPGLLERVIANLVANARRYTPPQERVRVCGRLAPEGGALRLEVVDRGPGIAPGDWERMFAPFQRLDDRAAGGVGLGLAIARGFTEAVGGTLTPSTTPGGGLTMTLHVPIAA
jgi:K+-sensing histidine kinase KdpD